MYFFIYRARWLREDGFVGRDYKRRFCQRPKFYKGVSKNPTKMLIKRNPLVVYEFPARV
jgi:hypothetical protein